METERLVKNEIEIKLKRIARYAIRHNQAFIACSDEYINKTLDEKAELLLNGKMSVE